MAVKNMSGQQQAFMKNNVFHLLHGIKNIHQSKLQQ